MFSRGAICAEGRGCFGDAGGITDAVHAVCASVATMWQSPELQRTSDQRQIESDLLPRPRLGFLLSGVIKDGLDLPKAEADMLEPEENWVDVYDSHAPGLVHLLRRWPPICVLSDPRRFGLMCEIRRDAPHPPVFSQKPTPQRPDVRQLSG